MMNCEVIRDLLPLYVDDACSEETRRMVDEHLQACPDCANMLKELQSNEIEEDLKEEKNEVIRYQAKRFKRRSAAVGSLIAGLFMIPIVVCLIVNVCTGAGLGWFFIVLAALGVAASLIVVPLMVPRDKLFWTFCAFCPALLALLAVCAFYTGGHWLLTAQSAVLFGLSAVFLPFVIRARPLQGWLGRCNKALVVLAVDVILFTNMMNMISLRTKSAFTSIRLGLFCLLAAGLVAMIVKTKKGEEGK